MNEEKLVQVTEGLAGSRADAGIAKLLGMSRSAVAAMIEDGLVQQNDQLISKSDSLVPDAWLRISLPKPKPALALVAENVEGLKVVYQDHDIVVVDKPAGVAAHPSVGWDGPSVGGALQHAVALRLQEAGAESPMPPLLASRPVFFVLRFDESCE